MEEQIKKIREIIQNIGIECGIEQAEKLCHFYNMIVEKNKYVNLTRITEFDDFVIKHIADSLSIYLLNDVSTKPIKLLESSKSRVLDLGTGAGFPGVPLAVLFPKPQYFLMDSLRKRIDFLEEALEKLSVGNAIPVHGRAEEMAKNENYREKFDICTSRAVANLSTLSEYAIPFVRKGGYFISYKSGDVEIEIINAKTAISKLSGKLNDVYSFKLPGADDINRTLVLIKKEKPTPKKYPRQAGTPKKNPL